jgi:hypothetical protein
MIESGQSIEIIILYRMSKLIFDRTSIWILVAQWATFPHNFEAIHHSMNIPERTEPFIQLDHENEFTSPLMSVLVGRDCRLPIGRSSGLISLLHANMAMVMPSTS